MKLELHWKIIIGLVLGLLLGMIAATQGWGVFVSNWISPFGKIFINLLKLIAVPLVLSSLITGVASLSDLKKLSRIGGRTISIYIATTSVAVTIGLLSVNMLQPGSTVPEDMKSKLQDTYQSSLSGRVEAAEEVKDRSALQPIVDMVPSNFFSSASNNRNMLQVVFVAIIIGIALIQINKNKAKPVLDFFEGINELVIKLVDNIMLMAPYGVFALIADTITSIAGNNINNVMEFFRDKDIIGEITVVVKGIKKRDPNPDKLIIKKDLNDLIDAGLSLSAASKYLSKRNGLKKSEIYKMI